jgi:hypothetical protein
MMEKKLTNSGPFMESTGKHSIYPLKQTLSQMEKLFRPRKLLSSLYVRQARSYLVVTHISLGLTFYQVAMQLD